VPLVICGPDVPSGRTSALASVIDLAPTFAGWANAETPAFVDGRSLSPILHGDPAVWRHALLIQLYRDHPDIVEGPPAFKALRGDGIVYVEYDDGFRELYDVTVDPYELDNLAGTADPDVIQTLSERLAVLATCAGAECRVIEDAPIAGQ
jgi:N-acetylglucosamine-6-sulfatase